MTNLPSLLLLGICSCGGLVTCFPQFDNMPSYLTVPEDSPIGTTLFSFVVTGSVSVTAAPPDLVTVNTSDGPNYHVILTALLDRETQSSHDLTFYTVDSVGNSVRSSLKLYIMDVNDNPPIFQQGSYTFSVKENDQNLTLGYVRATDPDRGNNGTVRYHIGTTNSSTAGLVDVDNITGRISLKHPVDYETVKLIHDVVVAEDLGTPISLSSIVPVSVHVVIVPESSSKPAGSLYSTSLPSTSQTSPRPSITTSTTRPITAGPTNTCQHGGLHVDNDGSARCYCAPGYVGQYCELDLDECMYNPCENNGTCVNTPGSYHCVCPAGSTGPQCAMKDCQDTAGFPCWIMVVFKMCDDVRIAAECGKSCNKCPQNNGQQAAVFVG